MSLAANHSASGSTLPLVAGGPGAPLPGDWSLADLCELLGGIPLERIRLFPSPGRATEEDLVRLNAQEPGWELTDGTLVRKAMGQYESELAAWIIARLHEYLAHHRLGKVFGPDCMARLLAGKVRGPDVCFVRYGRFPPGPRSREPVLETVPNLAIEVLSRGNTPAEMLRKREEYFGAGVEEVWEIDPKPRTARRYRSPAEFEEVPEGGALDGGTILPGFRIVLAELFQSADDMGPSKQA